MSTITRQQGPVHRTEQGRAELFPFMIYLRRKEQLKRRTYVFYEQKAPVIPFVRPGSSSGTS